MAQGDSGQRHTDRAAALQRVLRRKASAAEVQVRHSLPLPGKLVRTTPTAAMVITTVVVQPVTFNSNPLRCSRTTECRFDRIISKISSGGASRPLISAEMNNARNGLMPTKFIPTANTVEAIITP